MPVAYLTWPRTVTEVHGQAAMASSVFGLARNNDGITIGRLSWNRRKCPICVVNRDAKHYLCGARLSCSCWRSISLVPRPL